MLDFVNDAADVLAAFKTYHTLKNQGKRPMPLNDEDNPRLDPITEVGSGKVQDKQKAFLDEIIKKVNELFDGDLTPQDKLVYVNNVIMGKLLESETLKQQAANNTKEQFANSLSSSARITRRRPKINSSGADPP